LIQLLTIKLSLIQEIKYSNSVNQAMMEYTLHPVWLTHHQERVDSKFHFELMFGMMAVANNRPYSVPYKRGTQQSINME
jgi:hypothetical protein